MNANGREVVAELGAPATIGSSGLGRRAATWPLLLALLLVVGAALRFYALAFGLPYDMARPDEEKIILAALTVVGGDPNPHLFLYPSGFVYLLALAYAAVFAVAGGAVPAAVYAAGGVANPSLLHLVPRAISAAAGVATIAVVWAMSKEIVGRRAAAAAAFFLAVVFLHVRDSHFGTTDVPMTLAACLATWAAVRGATGGVTLRRAAIAGLLCGLAAGTKYNGVLVALPAAVAIGGAALFERRLPTRAELVALGLMGLCTVGAYLVTTPFTLIDWPGFARQFSEQQRIFRGAQNGSIIGPARAAWDGARGVSHYALFTLPHGVGLPLLLASVAGAAWLAIRQPRVALLVLSFPIAYYASMGTGQLVYARNMVPVVPFVCIAAGVLVDAVLRLPALSTSGVRVATAGIALCLLLALPTAAESIAFDRLVARDDTRALGSRWVETHFPNGASLFQTGVYYGHLDPQPRSRYTVAGFDGRRQSFADMAGGSMPDIVVRLDSPLSVYSAVPVGLDEVLHREYDLTQVYRALPPGPARGIYDRQDAWYTPYTRVAAAERPGPDVFIYTRKNGETRARR